MKVRKLMCLVLVSVLILSCSACSLFMPRVRSFDEIDMSHAVFALNANPQGAGGEVYYRKEGYVAIFNEDGSYQLVKTSGMFSQKPLWTSQGLFFSDQTKDFHVVYKNGQTVRKQKDNPKEPYQANVLEDADGSVINLYDLGFKTADDKTVINSLLIDRPFSDEKPHTIQSQKLDVVARCGQEFYGMHSNSLSSTDTNPALVNLSAGEVLSQDINTIAKGLGAKGDLLGQRMISPIFAPFPYSSSCVDGVFRTIVADDNYDSESKSLLFTLLWNIRTNEVRMNPLTVDGNAVAFSFMDSAYYLGNDRLLCADRLGNIYSVDILTGVTKLEIAQKLVEGKRYNNWETRMGVSQNYIVRADLNNIKDGEPSVKIWIFDRKTMKQVKVIDTPRDFAELMIGYRHLNNTAIAVKPDW